MSSIYDNIEQPILPKLQAYLKQAYCADFCVGHFNLRGWRQIDADIERFEGGDGQAGLSIAGGDGLFDPGRVTRIISHQN